MKTAIVQCPNTGCGRLSHLGDDPLGRIFRCPHCLTKLPSAAATAADSAWTAVLGLPRPGVASLVSRRIQPWRWVQPIPAASGARAWDSSGFESGEVLVGTVDLNWPWEPDHRSQSELGPEDSSEVLIEPFFSDGRSTSGWDAALMSSVSLAASDRSVVGPIDLDLVPAREVGLGRFRIVSRLGEGQHATVYRAYDPVLERDVALKVPRQGVLKTDKAIERFLGEAKVLARLRHPHIVPVYEAGCAGAATLHRYGTHRG